MMKIVRGRPDTIEEDTEVVDRILEFTSETREPAVRVWTPHRQVAFGKRDSRSESFEEAKQRAREHGFEPVVRRVGGHAVAYTGTTVTFVTTFPVDDMTQGLRERYENVTSVVEETLYQLGYRVERREPPNTFCPGDYSISLAQNRATSDGSEEDRALRKVVGIAQRVTRDAALVSGLIIVDEVDEISRVLGSVYGSLDHPLDTRTIGSLKTDPERVTEEIEKGLVKLHSPDSVVGSGPESVPGVEIERID